MRTYTRNEIKEILQQHVLWLKNEGGKRANLSGANLRYADLSGANLSGADLRRARLSDANLSGANLSGADLSDANLSGANLRYANLSDARLSGAYLRYADLSGARLSGARLSGADLSDANLSGADLSGAENIEEIIYNHTTVFLALQCPEEGSFIAWKTANNCIVKLMITEDAKRSSATTRKCRADKAIVLAIFNEEQAPINSTHGDRDKNFIYKVGETIIVDNYDNNRWNECSTGIHFFLTRKEAENWRRSKL